MSPNSRMEPDDSYFNDLSRQSNRRKNESPGSSQENNDAQNDGPDAGVPRTKRIACIICRKRKLKCDGIKPSCGTCTRLKHSCAYDEVRRKSGPKRGYVKELETRLAQVESLLKTNGSKNTTPGETLPTNDVFGQSAAQQVPPGYMNMDLGMDCGDDMESVMNSAGFFQGNAAQEAIPVILGNNNEDIGGLGETISWEMIGLGLDEPLPTQDVIDDLHQIYFDKIHPSVPTMHKYRYLAAMNLAPSMRPPVCLRYAMWSLAASVTDRYIDLHSHFYQRARKYIEMDEMKSHGEAICSVAHAQAWILISNYEYKMMYFPRAWMSTGRSIRLTQLMGLHRLDGSRSDCKQVLAPPRDWAELEERKRTFWAAYCGDRYASICTGWPMVIDNKDIATNLPATEDAFERNIPQETLSLEETFNSGVDPFLSPFGGVAIMSCFFGKNVTHAHQAGPDDRPFDLQGDFWKRHREMDNVLSKVSLSLPDHLRLPAGVRNSNVVFLNMEIHTSTICLHQAAICTADLHGLDESIIAESRSRSIVAATEIANIMRLISHIDVTSNHPMMVFCVYVAARVIVQQQRSRPDDPTVQSSLDFLVSAMRALKKKHPLAESFSTQLELDIMHKAMPPLNIHSSFTASQTQPKCGEVMGKNKCAIRFDGDPRKPESLASDPQTFHIISQFGGRSTQGGRQPAGASINLASREQRPPQQTSLFRHPSQPHIQADWIGSLAHDLTDNDLLHRYDTDVSSSDQQTTASNQPTPNPSHHSSSNTSYSSPHLVDDATNPTHSDTNPAFFATDQSFAGFTPPDGRHYASLAKADAAIGAFEWRAGTVVGTPSAGTTGLSPLGEGEWTQIMEGMGWEAGVLGQEQGQGQGRRERDE